MHVDESVSGGGGSGGGNGVAEAAAAWGRVKRRLRAELGEDVFASWFARLELDCVVGGTARLTVPTRFLKSWIESHYLDRVLNTFKAEVEEIARADRDGAVAVDERRDRSLEVRVAVEVVDA